MKRFQSSQYRNLEFQSKPTVFDSKHVVARTDMHTLRKVMRIILAEELKTQGANRQALDLSVSYSNLVKEDQDSEAETDVGGVSVDGECYSEESKKASPIKTHPYVTKMDKQRPFKDRKSTEVKTQAALLAERRLISKISKESSKNALKEQFSNSVVVLSSKSILKALAVHKIKFNLSDWKEVLEDQGYYVPKISGWNTTLRDGFISGTKKLLLTKDVNPVYVPLTMRACLFHTFLLQDESLWVPVLKYFGISKEDAKVKEWKGGKEYYFNVVNTVVEDLVSEFLLSSLKNLPKRPSEDEYKKLWFRGSDSAFEAKNRPAQTEKRDSAGDNNINELDRSFMEESQ